MTTFTSEDREKASQDVSIMVEPIPFVGWMQLQDKEAEGIPLVWKQQDKEDTEQMLREQIHAQQAEIQRLKRKIRELEDND